MKKLYDSSFERHVLKAIEEDENNNGLLDDEEVYESESEYTVIYQKSNILVVGFMCFGTPYEFTPAEDYYSAKNIGLIDEDTFDILDLSRQNRIEAWVKFNPEDDTFGSISLKAESDNTYNSNWNIYVDEGGQFNFTLKVIDENENDLGRKLILKNMDDDGVEVNGEALTKLEINSGDSISVSLTSDENRVIRVKSFIDGEEQVAPKGKWLALYIALTKETISPDAFGKLRT